MKKTTLELPEDLMRRVKLRAVNRQQKLKDAIAELLVLGLAVSGDEVRPMRAPKPIRLKGGESLNILELERAIGAGRS
jgi:hypothetical protein